MLRRACLLLLTLFFFTLAVHGISIRDETFKPLDPNNELCIKAAENCFGTINTWLAAPHLRRVNKVLEAHFKELKNNIFDMMFIKVEHVQTKCEKPEVHYEELDCCETFGEPETCTILTFPYRNGTFVCIPFPETNCGKLTDPVMPVEEVEFLENHPDISLAKISADSHSEYHG